jgi:hypothetical protein
MRSRSPVGFPEPIKRPAYNYQNKNELENLSPSGVYFSHLAESDVQGPIECADKYWEGRLTNHLKSEARSHNTESDQFVQQPYTIIKTERNENNTDSDFFNLTAEEGESQFAENQHQQATRYSGPILSPNVMAFKNEKYDTRSPFTYQAYQQIMEHIPIHSNRSKQTDDHNPNRTAPLYGEISAR